LIVDVAIVQVLKDNVIMVRCFSLFGTLACVDSRLVIIAILLHKDRLGDCFGVSSIRAEVLFHISVVNLREWKRKYEIIIDSVGMVE
jgi:hypothetical protein